MSGGLESLRASLLRGSRWACRKLGLDAGEADDVAHDSLVRAARDDFAALRGAGAGTPLSSWARGIAKNLVRERLRDGRPSHLPEDPSERPEPPAETADGWDSVDLSSLTDKEGAAIRERIGGRSEREAACRLGISRATFRDRMMRGVRRLQRVHGTLPALPEISRGWAEEMLERKRNLLRAEERECLRLYAEGCARREIARKLRTTVDGVRGRLRRLKRRFLGPT
jgi:DNA-directed RNA polymerase specialized sigma24 family protein